MIEEEDARSPEVGPHRGEQEEKEGEDSVVAVDPVEEGPKERKEGSRRLRS